MIMIFIDASYYVGFINPNDAHHKKAMDLKDVYDSNERITSYGILGELATVGSLRFDKNVTVKFIEQLLSSKEETNIILESEEIMEKTWALFKAAKSKNISWVDCYSVSVCHEYDIKKILSFDEDIPKLQKLAKKLFS